MTKRKEALFWKLFFLIFLWGVFLRCWGINNRAFWMDEAAVANLATDHSFSELLHQTELPVAPLFAILVKLTANLTLPPEVALRLTSILSGILIVPMAYFVMRALRLPRFTSLAAMLLCSSCPWLVLWSRELKQYELEAFTSLVLALLIFKLRRCSSAKKRWLLIAGIFVTCIFGPWFGYGFVFPAVALLAVLVLLKPVQTTSKADRAIGALGLCLLAGSMLLMMRFVIAAQSGDKALTNFVGLWFIYPASLWSWARAFGYACSCSVMILFPFYEFYVCGKALTILLGMIISLVVFLGLWTWPRKSRKEIIFWVVGPWVLLLIAAVAQRYPFGAVRMTVFLAVPMAMTFTVGLVFLCRRVFKVIRRRSDLGIVTALIILSLPAIYMFNVPVKNIFWIYHDFRKPLITLKQKRSTEEMVVVTIDAVQPVRYYAKNEDEGFLYYPYSSGTRPVPDFDYTELTRNWLANAGNHWWVLTICRAGDPTYSALMKEAKKLGYSVTEVRSEETRQYNDNAKLLLATKNTNNH